MWLWSEPHCRIDVSLEQTPDLLWNSFLKFPKGGHWKWPTLALFDWVNPRTHSIGGYGPAKIKPNYVLSFDPRPLLIWAILHTRLAQPSHGCKQANRFWSYPSRSSPGSRHLSMRVNMQCAATHLALRCDAPLGTYFCQSCMAGCTEGRVKGNHDKGILSRNGHREITGGQCFVEL